MSMPTLGDAIALAAESHAGQTDKAGAPYVLHLLRMMQAQQSTEARMAAALHDLVEDTDYTFEDLEEMGYPIVRRVKIADLKDNVDLEENMDATRLGSVGEEDIGRPGRCLRTHRRLAGREEAS